MLYRYCFMCWEWSKGLKIESKNGNIGKWNRVLFNFQKNFNQIIYNKRTDLSGKRLTWQSWRAYLCEYESDLVRNAKFDQSLIVDPPRWTRKHPKSSFFEAVVIESDQAVAKLALAFVHKSGSFSVIGLLLNKAFQKSRTRQNP